MKHRALFFQEYNMNVASKIIEEITQGDASVALSGNIIPLDAKSTADAIIKELKITYAADIEAYKNSEAGRCYHFHDEFALSDEQYQKAKPIRDSFVARLVSLAHEIWVKKFNGGHDNQAAFFRRSRPGKNDNTPMFDYIVYWICGVAG